MNDLIDLHNNIIQQNHSHTVKDIVISEIERNFPTSKTPEEDFAKIGKTTVNQNGIKIEIEVVVNGVTHAATYINGNPSFGKEGEIASPGKILNFPVF